MHAAKLKREELLMQKRNCMIRTTRDRYDRSFNTAGVVTNHNIVRGDDYTGRKYNSAPNLSGMKENHYTLTGNESDTTVRQPQLLLSQHLAMLKRILVHSNNEVWKSCAAFHALHSNHGGKSETDMDIKNPNVLCGDEGKEKEDDVTRKVIIIFITCSTQ